MYKYRIYSIISLFKILFKSYKDLIINLRIHRWENINYKIDEINTKNNKKRSKK